MTTKIEWTDEVWNPVTGCTKVSDGCKHCYAERIANRFWKSGQEIQDGVTTEVIDLGADGIVDIGTPLYRPRKFTDVICHDDRLEIPLKWRKPRRVFVNSMSDLFHPDVPLEFIDKVFAYMGRTQHHTYQILTKRPELMYDYISKGRYSEILNEAYKIDGKFIIDDGLGIGIGNPKNIPLPNVWLGVSCENQATADERIPWLLKTPAAIRFVSYEPALGPVDFKFTAPIPDHTSGGKTLAIDALDWIIAGGESGPGARPAHPDWFRSVRDQCVEACVPFFFKQWGEWCPDRYGMRVQVYRFDDGQDMWRIGKEKAGRELDGIVWNEYPEAAR